MVLPAGRVVFQFFFPTDHLIIMSHGCYNIFFILNPPCNQNDKEGVKSTTTDTAPSRSIPAASFQPPAAQLPEPVSSTGALINIYIFAFVQYNTFFCKQSNASLSDAT